MADVTNYEGVSGDELTEQTTVDEESFLIDVGAAYDKKLKIKTLLDYIGATRIFSALTTTAKTLVGAINELNGKTTDVKASSPWTYIEYSKGLIHAWRYASIPSAADAKTNTLGLPTPMKDAEYSVTAFPIFNGHLCHSIWAGTLSGADGRTATTVQISMDSTDSDSNVGIMVHIMGYRAEK